MTFATGNHTIPYDLQTPPGVDSPRTGGILLLVDPLRHHPLLLSAVTRSGLEANSSFRPFIVLGRPPSPCDWSELAPSL